MSFPTDALDTQPAPGSDLYPATRGVAGAIDDDAADVAEEAPGTDQTSEEPEDPAALRRQLVKAQAEAAEYRRRFTGLQPVVQREAERANHLAGQLQQYEARMVEQQIVGLPEEQQAAARMFYQMEQQQRQAQEEQHRQEAVMTAILKDTRMRELAQSQKVPQEVLGEFLAAMDAGPATALEFFATRMGKATKTTTNKQRQEVQADKFEGGGGNVSRQVKAPETMDEADVAFRAALRQMAAASRR